MKKAKTRIVKRKAVKRPTMTIEQRIGVLYEMLSIMKKDMEYLKLGQLALARTIAPLMYDLRASPWARNVVSTLDINDIQNLIEDSYRIMGEYPEAALKDQQMILKTPKRRTSSG